MSLDKRIAQLEKRHPSVKKYHRIIQKVGETEEEAISRYCEEKGIERESLNAPNVGLIIHVIVKPKSLHHEER